MRTIVYIDGFNLYYSLFDGPSNAINLGYKWLDLVALADRIVADGSVVLVRYFTARAQNSPSDPQQTSRQDAYLRALAARDRMEITIGKFTKSKREVKLVRPPVGLEDLQTAWVRQEKKTDIAFASHMLMDAVDDRMDQAILITNDSDYVMPIQLLRSRFQKRVGIISPDKTISRELKSLASFGHLLDRTLLPACQLPTVVIDEVGHEIHRPAAWKPRR